jgi:hypothetical protein
MAKFPTDGSQEGPCITQYWVVTALAIAKVSLAQPRGFEFVHCVSMSGVIAAIMLFAALPA